MLQEWERSVGAHDLMLCLGDVAHPFLLTDIMNPDTIAIGTILATAIALGGLRGGLVINRTGNVETEIRSVRTELTDRIDSVENRIDGVENRIDGVGKRSEDLRTELIGRSDRLRDEMLESYRRVDAGMRTIKQGFARIDQRLDTLKRAIIPSAEPGR